MWTCFVVIPNPFARGHLKTSRWCPLSTRSVTKGIARAGASFFFGVRIRLGTILGRFSIIYFRGLGLRIRVRVWVRARARFRVWVRVRIGVWVRVSVVLWSW